MATTTTTTDKIKGLQPVTRRLFCNNLKNKTVTKKMEEKIFLFNEIECEIYQTWQAQGLSKLQEKGLIFLYLNLAQNEDLSKNAKYFEKSENREMNVISETIAYFIKQKRKLYEKATKALTYNDNPELLLEIAKTIDQKLDAKKEIKRSIKAVKKAINECVEIFINGGIPSVELLQTALDAKASENNDIYAKQVSLINKTYIVVDNKNISKRDVPDEIKKITFEYIRGCAQYATYLHVNLINYIFLNEVISEEAFELLKEIKGDLSKCGMAILPYANAQTIIRSKKLLTKKTLTDAEKRLIKVMELYDPQAASIH